MGMCRFGVHTLDIQKWFSFVDHCFRPAKNRRFGIPLHSAFNWWSVELSLKPNWLEIYKQLDGYFCTSHMFQHLMFFVLLQWKSHLHLILSQFVFNPDPRIKHSECHPTVWKLSFSIKKTTVFFSNSFSCWHVSILCTWIHELPLFQQSCIRFLGMATLCV